MILKYQGKGFDGTNWSYLDGFQAITVEFFNTETAIKKYDDEVAAETRIDTASYRLDGDIESGELEQAELLPQKTRDANKVFEIASESTEDTLSLTDTHCLSALDEEGLSKALGAWAICLVYGRHRESAEIIITNQTAYLLNDRGQTVERIA